MRTRTRRRPLVARVATLGCSKNLVDSELIAGRLLTSGIGLSDDPGEADVALVNTCAFIPPARAEAAQALREALAWRDAKPGTRRVVVCGCLPKHPDPGEEAARLLAMADLAVGPDAIPLLGELVAGLFASPRRAAAPPPGESRYLYDHHAPRLQSTPAHYAYVKIADGCDNRCAYCSIPSIRGALRSREADSVVAEAESLLANGVRELILVAQDTTAFGRDRGESGGLERLLRRLDGIGGEFWVRVHYLHPAGIDDGLLSVMASGRRVLPYFDIPMQHAADRILASMGRRVTAAGLEELLGRLRRAAPGGAVRTTFITGYPGETEEEFEALLAFVRRGRFERLGVFPYHPEPGTPAAALPGAPPPEEAERRARAVADLQEALCLERNRSLVGAALRVVVDAAGRGREPAAARTAMDSPEVDMRVNVFGARRLKAGDMADVVVTGASAFELEARPVRGRGLDAC